MVATFELPSRSYDPVHRWISKSRVIQFIMSPLTVTVQINEDFFSESPLVFKSNSCCFHYSLNEFIGIMLSINFLNLLLDSLHSREAPERILFSPNPSNTWKTSLYQLAW